MSIYGKSYFNIFYEYCLRKKYLHLKETRKVGNCAIKNSCIIEWLKLLVEFTTNFVPTIDYSKLRLSFF